jgi:cold shock CspA family protein
MIGEIERLVLDRGYGYVLVRGERTPRFFHKTAVIDTAFEALFVGQKVEFEADEGSGRGPRAELVRVVSRV